MTKRLANSYYALVWNTALSEKDLVIQGEVISQNTVLPKDPRMMYGTNPNDVFKIRIERIKEEIKYDVFTTKQSVRFIKEVEEVELPRDVRIIVWEGSDTLHIPYDKYRIVTPQVFEELIKMSDDTQINTWNDPLIEEVRWKACAEPEEKLRGKVLNVLNFDFGIN